jgi:plastocyanin
MRWGRGWWVGSVLIALVLSGAAARSEGDSQDPRARRAARASIRGRVEFRRPPASLAPRPNIADLPMPARLAAPERRRSVVYLETAPRAAFEDRGDARVVMDQRNETFVPGVLAVVAGTSVEFPNSDNTYHNVFSLSRAKSFDLGRYPRGRSKVVRFDRPGVVRVFCEIHSHMNASILVFAHRFFAVTADDGSYRLDQVPPGTYTLVAWHEAAPSQSRQVVVPDRGGEVEVDFTAGAR